MDSLVPVYVFVFGACIGSFLDVCICRIPAGQSVIFPRSRCECGAPIPFWLNIPILSWLLLRGRARCCGRKISARYIIVELLTAVLFVAMFTVAQSPMNFIIGCIFCSILLVTAFIDIDRMEVYDAMVIGGMLVGIVLPLFSPSWHGEQYAPMALVDGLCGACFGSGLMFWIATFGEMAFKKEAIGGGDVKLMGMIGVFLGWKGCLFTIFGGCFLSTMVAVPPLLAWKILHWKDFRLSGEVPFVPFLAVGSIAYVIFGQNLLNWLF